MGRVAAAELLRQAQELLREAGLFGAVDVLGAMRLLAEVRSVSLEPAAGTPVLEAVPA